MEGALLGSNYRVLLHNEVSGGPVHMVVYPPPPLFFASAGVAFY